MTKKVKVFLIVLVVIIAGVGGYFVYNAQKAPSPEEKEVTKVTNKSTTKNVQGNGKTLVVYYSAQNHTKDVAQKVAENLGADLFEIEPKEKYSEDDLDWTDDDSRVTKEHEDTSLRNVELKTTEVENWDQYDTVFIGYPIWWGIAAWPVDTFVKANDFSNKTVIPFVLLLHQDWVKVVQNFKKKLKAVIGKKVNVLVQVLQILQLKIGQIV